ncbi:MAG: HNH endonuclease [Myxococcota bacterium]|nr:HNH endonuclease [Myxococcota bacterium]
MPRQPKVRELKDLFTFIDDQLRALKKLPADLDLRGKVLLLVPLRHHIDDLGVSVAVAHGYDARAAMTRIREYLREYVGQVIHGDEIAVVSGISEYGRRIRQLRVEEGYRILSGATPDPDSGVTLKPDEYVLVAVEPDADAARRWHVANRIRRGPSGAKAKLLDYLRENVKRVVTTEELRYVADTAEFARRIRELRTEEGYAVATMFTGRPDLRMGEYIMLSADRVAEPHDRHISIDVQQEVFRRDNNRCRLCRWDVTRWTERDPRILEIHHLREHAKRGANERGNLIVICSRCHDKVHAGRLRIPFKAAE